MKKTLRGKPYEHFRHETGPEGSESVERKGGNQTPHVFMASEASLAPLKLSFTYML
jgi:hypothetical protein